MAYDNAGNLINDTYIGSVSKRTYDAENRMTSETRTNNVKVGEYVYDGGGRRVVRNVNGVVTWQVYGPQGEFLAEYPQNGSPTSPEKEYGYRNGEELFTGRDTTPDYGAGDTVRQKFTLKERDVETGLDYFLARYYGAMLGRFTSADPLNASARPMNPQSWNRYSYVLNRPLALIDPTGMHDCTPQTPCTMTTEAEAEAKTTANPILYFSVPV